MFRHFSGLSRLSYWLLPCIGAPLDLGKPPDQTATRERPSLLLRSMAWRAARPRRVRFGRRISELPRARHRALEAPGQEKQSSPILLSSSPPTVAVCRCSFWPPMDR